MCVCVCAFSRYFLVVVRRSLARVLVLASLCLSNYLLARLIVAADNKEFDWTYLCEVASQTNATYASSSSSLASSKPHTVLSHFQINSSFFSLTCANKIRSPEVSTPFILLERSSPFSSSVFVIERAICNTATTTTSWSHYILSLAKLSAHT